MGGALVKHGRNRRGARDPVYSVWVGMNQRCYDPNHISYKHYGGKGITVCERWRASFTDFIVDVGERPTDKRYSLDRIDGSRGYEPGNVRWTTQDQQMRNSSKAHYIEANGKRLCVADWDKELGMKGGVTRRMCLGWSEYEAVTTPKGEQRYRS